MEKSKTKERRAITEQGEKDVRGQLPSYPANRGERSNERGRQVYIR